MNTAKFGLFNNMDKVEQNLGVALGKGTLNPLQMAQAYSVFWGGEWWSYEIYVSPFILSLR